MVVFCPSWPISRINNRCRDVDVKYCLECAVEVQFHAHRSRDCDLVNIVLCFAFWIVALVGLGLLSGSSLLLG